MKDHIRSDWAGVILVCGKCSKKLGGGFGDDGRIPLAKALRRASRVRKGRKAALGVVETQCLGICPKRAVVVVDAAQPARWEIIGEGSAVGDVLARLGRGI